MPRTNRRRERNAGCAAALAVILLIPGHCDPTVNLHDWYVCIRGMESANAHVEAIWPVAARGAGF